MCSVILIIHNTMRFSVVLYVTCFDCLIAEILALLFNLRACAIDRAMLVSLVYSNTYKSIM